MQFETAIERVLSHEGGYVNDARDPGGETQWGISKRAYPALNIRDLTREDAKAIYEADYWTPLTGMIDDGALRFQMFHAAVNHGMGNATRMLQRAVGAAADGYWGEHSAALLARMDVHDARLRMLAERLEFWTSLRAFDTFGRGWTRRGAQNLRYLSADT